MAVIDLDKLLKEVSTDAPCGEDLEYDPAFGAMVRAATGKVEQQIGTTVMPAVEPEWGEVRGLATDLLGRTKDLRVAIRLARALASTNGFQGIGDGVALVRGLIERFWDSVHPRLDPDDGNDPTFRMNALAELGDREGLVQRLRLVPLANSRRAGRFSLRDIEVATGALTRPAGDESAAPDMTIIDAAFMDTEIAELESASSGVQRALGDLVAMEAFVAEKVGASRTPDLAALRSTLKAIQDVLARQMARRGMATEGNGGDPVTTGSTSTTTGEVTSREAVIRLLDKACEYYARYEPSSPVPLLLERAKRLVTKDFLEAVRDIAPGGLAEVQAIGGLDKEQ